MLNSTSKFYQSFPKWREVRETLVKEVYGKNAIFVEYAPQKNKVSSREKSIRKKLSNKSQLDDQKYHDFLLACDGFNTVSFCYDSELDRWIFNASNFTMQSDVNLNEVVAKNSNEYDAFAADLLTKIHNIKRYQTSFQGKIYLGRCIAILADEIDRFFSISFKRLLAKLYKTPDVTKTILQMVFLAFNEPISLMEKFLFNVNESNAIGGFLLNLIKKERTSLDKCYQSFFHDILTRSYERGMEFYVQLLTHWLNDNNLDNDLFFEFFIWDVSKRRFSSSVGSLDSLIIASDETIYLNSLNPASYYNLFDVKTFKRQYLIVPDLCPTDLDEALRQSIIRTGLYNHVLQIEDPSVFNAEFKSAPVESLKFENIGKLPKLVKSRYSHSGRIILRHLCNQLEFTILMEKLPVYFCGIKNSIIDDFVGLTENFNWSGLSRQQNTKLGQLNRFYQRAVELSPFANDPLSQVIGLEFSVAGYVDSSHPPVANQAAEDRPFTDLEPVLFCKDSFRLAFPPTTFELYRNMFRLRHTLRRAFNLLKNKFFSQRHQLPRAELNKLSLMIRFVQSYDNFIFGYKASKLVHEYLALVKDGISKNTIDLDTFLKEHEQMLKKLHSTAFVSSNPEYFSNPMWSILTRMINYARDTNDFNTACIQICHSLKRIKKYLQVQQQRGEVLPELAEWLFGTADAWLPSKN